MSYESDDSGSLYPTSARPSGDPRSADGKSGSEKSHALAKSVESLYVRAKDKVSNKSLKNNENPTVGSQLSDGAKSATNFIKGFDPKNLSGAVPFGLNLVKSIQSNSGAGKLLGDIAGPEISKLISQFTSALNGGQAQIIQQITDKIEQAFQQSSNNTANTK